MTGGASRVGEFPVSYPRICGARKTFALRPCSSPQVFVHTTVETDKSYNWRQVAGWTFTLNDKDGRRGTLSATLIQ